MQERVCFCSAVLLQFSSNSITNSLDHSKWKRWTKVSSRHTILDGPWGD